MQHHANLCLHASIFINNRIMKKFFNWVKYWQMTFILPKYFPARILCYMVFKLPVFIQSYFLLLYSILAYITPCFLQKCSDKLAVFSIPTDSLQTSSGGCRPLRVLVTVGYHVVCFCSHQSSTSIKFTAIVRLMVNVLYQYRAAALTGYCQTCQDMVAYFINLTNFRVARIKQVRYDGARIQKHQSHIVTTSGYISTI